MNVEPLLPLGTKDRPQARQSFGFQNTAPIDIKHSTLGVYNNSIRVVPIRAGLQVQVREEVSEREWYNVRIGTIDGGS